MIGSGPERRSVSEAAWSAATRVVKAGLAVRRSSAVQASPHAPGGTANCREGGAAGRGGSAGPGRLKGANAAPNRPNVPGSWASTEVRSRETSGRQ